MGNEWGTGLLDCTNDMKSCLIVMFVPGGLCCIQAIAVKRATGEGACVPFICVCLLGCVGGAINRGKIRRRYNISGSFLHDLLTWCGCPLCAACQEYRTSIRY